MVRNGRAFHRRRMASLVALAIVACATLVPPLHGGQMTRIITVDSMADEVDAVPGDGMCASSAGHCTLRAAIQEANHSPGPDTIVLPAGTYKLTIPGRDENDAAAGDLDILDTVTITGAGSAQTSVEAAAEPSDRVFEIHGGDVKIAGLTIRNGAAFNANNQRTEGGGIFHRSGNRLTLVDVVLQNNYAGQGGGLWSSGASVIAKDVVFDGNSTAEGGVLDHEGGGIYINAGTLTVENGVFRNNFSSAGGALAVHGTVTLAQTTIADNRATPFFSPCLGGGIYNRGTVTITRSVLSANVAGNGGCEGKGAAIWNSSSMVVENTTISSNHANQIGGALFNEDSVSGTVTLRNVTIFGNDAPTGGGIYNQASVNVVNTLVAGDSDGAAHASDCSGTLISQGHNLIQSLTGCTVNGDTTTNIVGRDPKVGPLAENGGRTPTHALLPGSPAIDAGDDGACPQTDQRSTVRPLDGDGDGTARCDIGAYELDLTQHVSAVAIAAGDGHTCAITTPGGLRCWGATSAGELGAPSTERCGGVDPCSTTPKDVVWLGGRTAAVAIGVSHTCAVTVAGAMKCWGANLHGQIGNGTTVDSPAPVAVLTGDGSPIGGIAGVAAGGAHTCALTNDARVICWGDNRYGEVGDGTFADRSTPVEVFAVASGVRMLATHGNHTCVLIGAAIQCWGRNGYGQVGNGTTSDRPSATQVVGFVDPVTAIGVGAFHSCGVAATRVKCWGANLNGQLGDGTTCCGLSQSRPTPVDVLAAPGGSPLADVIAVALGYSHTCALLASGTLKCWGDNRLGQLGDGTTTSHLTPVDVLAAPGGSPLSHVSAIVSGDAHTCALTATGAVKCWGGNGVGQVGDGTTIARSTPVDVLGFRPQ